MESPGQGRAGDICFELLFVSDYVPDYMLYMNCLLILFGYLLGANNTGLFLT